MKITKRIPCTLGEAIDYLRLEPLNEVEFLDEKDGVVCINSYDFLDAPRKLLSGLTFFKLIEVEEPDQDRWKEVDELLDFCRDSRTSGIKIFDAEQQHILREAFRAYDKILRKENEDAKN